MLVIIPNQGSQPCIKHHPAATPMDSVLYPLRRFPVSFATDTGTFGYSQAQHLFADSFRGCPFFKNRHFSFLPSRRVEATSVGILEEYIGVEPTLSAWRAEVLTVIRILHKIAGEPSFSPAMMFV